MTSTQQSYCRLLQTQPPTSFLLQSSCDVGHNQVHVKGWHTYRLILALYCSLEEI